MGVPLLSPLSRAADPGGDNPDPDPLPERGKNAGPEIRYGYDVPRKHADPTYQIHA